jgi:hypothetical protein
MKKGKDDFKMKGEYDFSRGVRGKYAKQYAAGNNVVVLDPDVAKAFPNSKSVNEALRGLVEIIHHQPKTASV